MLQRSAVTVGGNKKKPSVAEKPTDASDRSLGSTAKKGETKRPEGKPQQKQRLSVVVEESIGRRTVQNMKAITIQSIARAVGVKISVANAYVRSLEAKGVVKCVGGYSGHKVYQLVDQQLLSN
jgi:small subunit ribosomal protein S25e